MRCTSRAERDERLAPDAAEFPQHEEQWSSLGEEGYLRDVARCEAKRRIEAAGGKVASSVSKKTSFLVAGEEPGGKLRKAQELGVEILDAAGLEQLLSA